MTEYIRCTRSKKEVSFGSCNFDVRDQKGRTVGYRYATHEVIYTPTPVDQGNAFWSIEVGAPLHVFEVWSQPTRNGMVYGPSNTAVVFTLDRARRLIERRVSNARKRETKRFGQYSPVPA